MTKTITYLLTNLITGDSYVGVTSDRLGLKQRCAHHKARAKKGDHNHLPLYKNINEHGWNNFYCQTLCEGDDEKFMVWLLQPTLNQCWNGRVAPDNVKQASRDANSKPVRCLETGVVYPSATEAGLALGKPKGFSAISNNLKGKSETAYGFTWRYTS